MEINKIMHEKNNSAKNKISNTVKIVAIIIVLILAVVLFFPNLLKKHHEDSEYMFRKDGTLTFLSDSNKVLTNIDIQIASSEFDRELGLMYRKHMKENNGMLFIFPNEEVQNFWMRNTFIPLDMIFVNSKKEIVTIQHATQTLSDQTYSSNAPAQYVIEVNAGFCNRFNIKKGDLINWTDSTGN
jgi:uncharacterized membrane protein (UPF0127 family)